MNTDEKILDIVAKHGFTLPEDVELDYPTADEDRWRVWGLCPCDNDETAYNMIAMSFAKQNTGRHGMGTKVVPLVFLPLCNGDGKRTIDALWEALNRA